MANRAIQYQQQQQPQQQPQQQQPPQQQQQPQQQLQPFANQQEATDDVAQVNRPVDGVTPMKQKKRDQINAIAKKEEEDYEKYKESRRLRNVNEAPSATGGAVPREEALKRYENQIKSEKYRAKVKRDGYKAEQKSVEEDEIRVKKEAARRQAEKNNMLGEQRVQEQRRRNEDETRRNRLKYFANMNTQVSLERAVCSPSDKRTSTTRSRQEQEASWERQQKPVVTPTIATINRTVEHTSNLCSNQMPYTNTSTSMASSSGDDIITLVEMFPDLDVQLLSDVYSAQGHSLQKAIDFFQ